MNQHLSQTCGSSWFSKPPGFSKLPGVFTRSRLRGVLREVFFRFLHQLTDTHDAKQLWSHMLKDQLQWQPHLPVSCQQLSQADQSPYADLGRYHTQQSAHSALTGHADSQQRSPIFITGRFRSGSTLVWNLFRHLENITAYYEPFNERRWFDSQLRGNRVDGTHKNVTAYWQEYDAVVGLEEYYREAWTHTHLYMDPHSWDPLMKRYVSELIAQAPGRPCLQFNRIDFRLAWFRQHFPEATIIHLYRHPRDQWCSSLMDLAACPKEAGMAEFAAHDHFYLRQWAQDLSYHFPFLEEQYISHPYQLFYYIWKLSYLFGSGFAHISLAFEQLLEAPQTQLQTLFHTLNIEPDQIQTVLPLIDTPALGKWRSYADAAWFEEHERQCESVLAEFWPHFV